LDGRQEGHTACKMLSVGLLVMMIWLELCSSSCNHHILSSSKIQNGDILVPGPPGKMAAKMEKDGQTSGQRERTREREGEQSKRVS